MSAAPTLAPATPFGQAAEHLIVKLRADLVVQPQFYEGMTHYVIKDPLALKYFRFKIEEYFLLQQFDGKQNLQDVKKAFERKYRPQTISIEDLTRFVAQLHEAGIILIDSPEQAKVLIRRRRKNRWRKIGQFFANILYIKIPIFDPEKRLQLHVASSALQSTKGSGISRQQEADINALPDERRGQCPGHVGQSS